MFAREIWNGFNAFAWHNFLLTDVWDQIKAQARGPQTHVFGAALCGIWRWRNDDVSGDKSWTTMSIVNDSHREE